MTAQEKSFKIARIEALIASYEATARSHRNTMTTAKADSLISELIVKAGYRQLFALTN